MKHTKILFKGQKVNTEIQNLYLDYVLSDCGLTWCDFGLGLVLIWCDFGLNLVLICCDFGLGLVFIWFTVVICLV